MFKCCNTSNLSKQYYLHTHRDLHPLNLKHGLKFLFRLYLSIQRIIQMQHHSYLWQIPKIMHCPQNELELEQ